MTSLPQHPANFDAALPPGDVVPINTEANELDANAEKVDNNESDQLQGDGDTNNTEVDTVPKADSDRGVITIEGVAPQDGDINNSDADTLPKNRGVNTIEDVVPQGGVATTGQKRGAEDKLTVERIMALRAQFADSGAGAGGQVRQLASLRRQSIPEALNLPANGGGEGGPREDGGGEDFAVPITPGLPGAAIVPRIDQLIRAMRRILKMSEIEMRKPTVSEWRITNRTRLLGRLNILYSDSERPVGDVAGNDFYELLQKHKVKLEAEIRREEERLGEVERSAQQVLRQRLNAAAQTVRNGNAAEVAGEQSVTTQGSNVEQMARAQRQRAAAQVTFWVDTLLTLGWTDRALLAARALQRVADDAVDNPPDGYVPRTDRDLGSFQRWVLRNNLVVPEVSVASDAPFMMPSQPLVSVALETLAEPALPTHVLGAPRQQG